MRLEKAYHAWGADFGTEYTLFDADLAKFADLSKSDFTGREAFIKQSESKPEWRFIKLVISNDDADAMPGDPVLYKNQCVGFISSGGTGFRIGRSIALAYIQNDVNPQATQFSVNILGQLCPATLSQRAFYDPDNERLRS